MSRFVNPSHLVQDPRAQDEKEKALAENTCVNLHYMNKQLAAHGHSLETLLSALAKQVWGLNIDPHAPKPKES